MRNVDEINHNEISDIADILTTGSDFLPVTVSCIVSGELWFCYLTGSHL